MRAAAAALLLTAQRPVLGVLVEAALAVAQPQQLHLLLALQTLAAAVVDTHQETAQQAAPASSSSATQAHSAAQAAQ